MKTFGPCEHIVTKSSNFVDQTIFMQILKTAPTMQNFVMILTLPYFYNI